MKIKKIILEKWIDPALITHHLTKKFGDKGLAWLDSDGKENGEWSIIGIKPKKIIQSRDINNLDKTNNPFNNLRNIEKGFWIGWLSYEAGVYIEPKNPWKKSNMATLWIASYDPIIKCNLIKKEIIIEGTNSSELMNYKNIINNIKNIEEENIIKTKLNFDFSKINLDEMAEKFQKNILKLKKLISLGLESFLKVHHLTSVIRGKLKKDKNWIDLLKACWPGGSITGAPKLRSCQRLFELEECERGPYCGSFLKLDWNGEFDSNILIRSFLIKDKKINIYAGCGIVIDSNPEEETNELKWKLLPLIDSLK